MGDLVLEGDLLLMGDRWGGDLRLFTGDLLLLQWRGFRGGYMGEMVGF